VPRIRITDEYSLVKRKGSDNWYLEWRERGEKVRRSCSTTSVELAKEAARNIILKDHSLKDEAPQQMPLSVVLGRYWLNVAIHYASKSSEERAINLWNEYFPSATVSDLSVERLETFTAWLYGKGYSRGYVRRVLASGKAALNRSWKRQEITSVPYVQLPKPGDPYEHYSSLDQLAAILNLIPEESHLWAYMMIRLGTGCRQDAALQLRPDQVDFDNSLVRLNPVGREQTKKFRPVLPMTAVLRQFLLTQKTPTTYVHWHLKPIKSARTAWNRLKTRAELPEWFSPKVLRHTIGTEMRKREVPGWEVSGQLGHKGGESARTTEVYAKFDPSFLGKARQALDALMLDLSKKVPALKAYLGGATQGSAQIVVQRAQSEKVMVKPRVRLVEPVGIEPTTSTMPSLGVSIKINNSQQTRITKHTKQDQAVDKKVGSVRGQRKRS